MRGQPSGTVTFLFTDLEGSTRLWEERPTEMAVALARHDELLHTFIGSRNGFVFSGTGDGVAASFEHATDAARAAIEIQVAMANEPWPDDLGQLRARMGLHSGEAEIRDGNYYGSTVNRAARVMAIAWGGQTVCTAATASMLADTLDLRDLGEHRLRDLSRPEHVWQLGGDATFPPLRSGSNLPGNLPTQTTEFVGRADELRNVRAAAESARIVTLTGVGGAGKTRLALQFAAEAQSGFGNGAWLCDLAPLSSPDAVGPLVASVLRIEPGDDGWIAAITSALADRKLLLLLDNCEHVLDAAATLAGALVSRCPEVLVLATSREGLGVAGERILPVGSLALPQAGDQADVVVASDAVALFISRARDVRLLATDDAEAVAAIVQICRRLDGIPLAIELAAARTQSLSVADIASHLDDRFRLLTRGARTALDRHQTLRAAVDWSFDLLSDEERRVLERASVFAGGFTLDAAAAVCDPETTSPLEMLEHVDGLVRRSLLIAEEDATSTRYRMLETIRQYAAERLEAVDDPIAVSQAHLDWCVSLSREAGEQLRRPKDAAWIARMEREIDNIRIALQFAVSMGDVDATRTLLGSAPLGALWDSRLGASIAAMARDVAPDLGEPDHPVSAALLSLLALDAALRFAGDEAVELSERAVAVARRHDDWLRTGPWLAWFLSTLIAGRVDTLTSTAREALARAITEDDAFATAEWRSLLGVALWMVGDTDEAETLTEGALALAEEVGADNLVMRNAFLRGASLLGPGSDPAVAFSHFQRAVQLGEHVGGNVLYGGAAWAVLLSNRGSDDMSAAELALQLVVANLPTPMFVIDSEPKVVAYNDATATILGKSFAEVGEIRADEFGASLELGTVDGQPMQRRDTPTGIAFFQHRPVHQPLAATTYDGRRVYQVTAHPLFGRDGAVEGVVTVFWEQTNDTYEV